MIDALTKTNVYNSLAQVNGSLAQLQGRADDLLDETAKAAVTAKLSEISKTFNALV